MSQSVRDVIGWPVLAAHSDVSTGVVAGWLVQNRVDTLPGGADDLIRRGIKRRSVRHAGTPGGRCQLG